MTAEKYSKVRSLSEFTRRCILLISVILLTGPAAAQPVPLFSASYKVHYGILHGEMTLELRHADGVDYVYETSLTPKGLVTLFRRGSIIETTSLQIEDDVLRPLDYRSTDTIADPTRHTVYRFDDPEGRITGAYKEREVDEPMRPNGHNRISAHVAVMLAMNTGADMTASRYSTGPAGATSSSRPSPGRPSKTPLGEFETVEIRYSSEKKDKSWSLYCAEALDFAPVMIIYREDDDIKSKAQLVEYESLDEAAPGNP